MREGDRHLGKGDALLLCFRFCIRHVTDIKITIITLIRPDPASAKSRQNFPWLQCYWVRPVVIHIFIILYRHKLVNERCASGSSEKQEFPWSQGITLLSQEMGIKEKGGEC